MIFLNGHGRSAVPDYSIDMYGQGPVMSQSAACGFVADVYPDTPVFGPFAYLFGEVPEMPHSPESTAALDM
ncbi:MAG: hypothetical protein AAGA95_09095, partial [Pseudomonadota bacterium]